VISLHCAVCGPFSTQTELSRHFRMSLTCTSHLYVSTTGESRHHYGLKTGYFEWDLLGLSRNIPEYYDTSVHDGSFHVLSSSLFANPATWPKHVSCPSVDSRGMGGRQV